MHPNLSLKKKIPPDPGSLCSERAKRRRINVANNMIKPIPFLRQYLLSFPKIARFFSFTKVSQSHLVMLLSPVSLVPTEYTEYID